MSSALTTPPPPAGRAVKTIADLLHELGDIPPERVLLDPPPGTATEADVVRFVDGDDKRLVEMIDGTLVEKTTGAYEGRIGLLIGHFIEDFLEQNDLGIAFGADALFRILPRQVRLPDVSFVPWTKLPNRELPAEPVAALVLDLAVEVLSESNTRREMERKRQDYFTAGVRLVWEIDPDDQTADVYTDPDTFTTIAADGELDGGEVLPGFRLSLKRLFDRAGKRRGA